MSLWIWGACVANLVSELQRLKPPDFVSLMSWLKPRPIKIFEP